MAPFIKKLVSFTDICGRHTIEATSARHLSEIMQRLASIKATDIEIKDA